MPKPDCIADPVVTHASAPTSWEAIDTGSGSSEPQSDGQSGFYVDAAGDPIFVQAIYDEEAKTFTYQNASGNPLVPGIDFLPNNKCNLEDFRTQCEAVIPDDLIIPIGDITVESSNRTRVTNDGSQIIYDATGAGNNAVLDLGIVDLSQYAQPEIKIGWNVQGATGNYACSLSVGDGTNTVGSISFQDEDSPPTVSSTDIPNTVSDLKFYIRFPTGWRTNIVITEVTICETADLTLEALSALRVKDCNSDEMLALLRSIVDSK